MIRAIMLHPMNECTSLCYWQVVNLVTPILAQYRSLYRCAVQQLSSSIQLQATPIDRSEGVMFRQVGAVMLLLEAVVKRSISLTGHLAR